VLQGLFDVVSERPLHNNIANWIPSGLYFIGNYVLFNSGSNELAHHSQNCFVFQWQVVVG
jgi:hypothetical protein